MSRPPRALLFDLDGTLYLQAPVRRRMALRLAGHLAKSPAQGLRDLRLLRAYRRAQEYLRSADHGGSAEEQLRLSLEWTGCDPARARLCIERWMQTEPLDVLPRHVRPGIAPLLKTARQRGLKLGVVSDYPAVQKLRVMGLLDSFDTVVCAQEAGIDVFKPSPRSLLAAASVLGVAPADAVYIGDRPEVDAEAARRAGMPSIMIAGTSHRLSSNVVADFPSLDRLLFGTSR
jgi:HAD superfamily hydrolase (TIGR01509 family)